MKNFKFIFRDLLALILVLFAMSIISYIVIRWGDKTEILTLIIGLVGGTIIGGIMGTYYSSTHRTTPAINDEIKAPSQTSIGGENPLNDQ